MSQGAGTAPGQVDLQAQQGLQAALPAGDGELHRAGEQVVVGQADGGHAARGRGLDQFCG